MTLGDADWEMGQSSYFGMAQDLLTLRGPAAV